MESIYLSSILEVLKENRFLGGVVTALTMTKPASFDDACFETAKNWASGGLKEESEFLLSIFSAVEIKGRKASKGYHFQPGPMRFSKDFFPFKEENYTGELFSEFKTEVSQVDQSDPKYFAETLLFLIQKYGVALPSPAGEDVSFYDYCKVVAGLTVCLHRYAGDVLLIGGGVSGIQNYLYDIIRRKAAINLKGRSFYLQLLIDEVVQFILEKLELFQANILYASGGNFYLLAPGDLLPKVEQLEFEITKRLFEKYRTGLRVELAGVIMEERGLSAAPGEYWKAIGQEIMERKQRPFEYMIDQKVKLGDGQSGFEFFFTPQEVGGEALRDAITNEEISNPNNALPLEPNSPVVNLVLPSTLEQKKLGQKLKRAEYITIHNQATKGSVDPGQLDFHYRVTDKLFTKSKSSSIQAFAINRLDFFDDSIPGTQGFKLFGGSAAPVFLQDDPSENNAYKKGDMKTFEDLAMGVESFVRLGFLRMDVDDLGRTLGEVSNAKSSSLARIGTFSRSLDYFFKGYLNYLWQNDPDYSQYSQIIYAGGDDLFIVGRWDVMIRLAMDIRKEFAEWVCHHPGISLSGGLAFVTPKFPISKAATMAGDAEDIAKDYEFLEGDTLHRKNAFTLLGIPLHWDHDMPIVEDLKQQLVEFILLKEIPKSVLMNIQRFHSKKVFQEQNKLPSSWRWRMAYMLARAGERISKRKVEAKQFLKDLSISIFSNSTNRNGKISSQHEFFDLLNVAARWAELQLRITKDKN